MAVSLPPMGEQHTTAQLFDFGIGQDDKLLVGRRIEPELVALLLKDTFHLHGHVDGVTRQLEIEVVGEERLEL